MGLSYEESKKFVFKGLWILAAITLVEVGVSLFGKGHLGWNPESLGTITLPFTEFSFNPLLAVVAFALIGLSLYKAYFIVYDFMHMRYEAKGLAMSVLLPMFLLVWAVIAFFHEGDSWKNRNLYKGNFVAPDTEMEAKVSPESFNATEMKEIEKF